MNSPALERACIALWTATLSLMAAYMQQPAPAHRLLLARRIAANFSTLAGQDSFAADCREAFARLSSRWQAIADGHGRPAAGAGGRGLLERLLPLGPQRL
jgi:hypothetical protein